MEAKASILLRVDDASQELECAIEQHERHMQCGLEIHVLFRTTYRACDLRSLGAGAMERLPPDEQGLEVVRPTTNSPTSRRRRRSDSRRNLVAQEGQDQNLHQSSMMTLLVDSTKAEAGPRELFTRQRGKRPRKTSSSSILSDGISCSTVGTDEAESKGLIRDLDVVQQAQPSCSREHLEPGYTFPDRTKTTEGPWAQLDAADHAFGEAEAMAEDEELSPPRNLQMPHCSSAGGNFARPTGPSRISTERAHTSSTFSSWTTQDMRGFRNSELAAPTSTSAATRGMIASTDMHASAPSQTWYSSLGSQSTWQKGSERPGQDDPRQSERSGSGSLKHFKTHQGSLTSTSCNSSTGFSQGRMPPGGDQLDSCNRNDISGGASPSRNHSPFPRAGREVLQSTINQLDSAHGRVRRDLQLYMKAVRKKTSEDGTPSVIFPKNFNKVVGLMSRNDLAEPAYVNRADGANGGKAPLGEGADGGRAPPLWSKYLLDEGLDRTKTFEKCRGLFAEDETGKERLMRGLAKMRELDLRLARVTERARGLKKMSLEVAAEAENESTNVSKVSREPRHTRGRGPIAIDESTNTPSSTPSTGGANHSAVVTPKLNRSTKKTEGESRDDDTNRQALDRQSVDKAFVTQNGNRFRGPGGGSSRTLDVDAAVTSSSNSLAGSDTGASPTSRRCTASKGDRDRGVSSDPITGNSGLSFVLRNKRHAARAHRRLTDEQEDLVSRLLADADGFDDNGKEIGEPSGVWAEIAPYGGAGAIQCATRLAEIDAQVASIRGHGDGDFTRNTKRKTDQVTSREKETDSPPSRRKDSPGETALREQRADRQMRHRERGIDAALEKVREALFQGSYGEMRRRESAIDAALEIARAAPLNIQAGIRQGAGRVDSLLAASGPQPVGEWELKHILRQSEHELQDKELANQERIEELIATVRRESAGALRASKDLDCTSRTDIHAPNEHGHGLPSPGIVDLETFFSLREEASEGPTTCIGALSKTEATYVSSGATKPLDDHQRGGPEARRKEYVGAKGISCREDWATVRGQVQSAGNEQDQQVFSVPLNAEGASEDSNTGGPAALYNSDVPEVKPNGPKTSQQPRRNPRKIKQTAEAIAVGTATPEVTALFRAPLLTPNLYPPIAGIAAAAVASSGSKRLKERVTATGGALATDAADRSSIGAGHADRQQPQNAKQSDITTRSHSDALIRQSTPTTALYVYNPIIMVSKMSTRDYTA